MPGVVFAWFSRLAIGLSSWYLLIIWKLIIFKDWIYQVLYFLMLIALSILWRWNSITISQFFWIWVYTVTWLLTKWKLSCPWMLFLPGGSEFLAFNTTIFSSSKRICKSWIYWFVLIISRFILYITRLILSLNNCFFLFVYFMNVLVRIWIFLNG